MTNLNLLQGAKNAAGEAEAAADEALVEMGSSWSTGATPRWLSASLLNAPGKMAELSRLFGTYKKKLGPLENHDPFTLENINTGSSTGGGHTFVTIRCPAKFEKGPGTILMRMRKEDGEWKVYGFYVLADKLR